MRRRLVAAVILALLPFLLTVDVRAGDWTGFYDDETLRYWHGETPPGVEENFREVMWPMLTAREKGALGRITLEFPLEDARHPVNFYATAAGGKKTITLPISSLRFLGDMALAYVWLEESGYSLEPITDYLAMLKYQWPEGLAGRRYRPREALGIPEDAMSRPGVEEQFQRVYGTVIVFVLGHELGHLYHGHDATVSAERSRRQEEEADRFAMELMRRMGEAPVGMVQFFHLMAHLEPYSSDPGYAAGRAAATHPLSSSRLVAIADRIETDAADFTRTGTRRATLMKIAGDVRVIARNFEDPGVQELIRQKGLTARPELLGPRKPGAGVPVPVPAPASRNADVAFTGHYTGKWVDAKGSDLDVEMNLTRQRDVVRGTYTFGAGNVSIEGTVVGDVLHYNWTWGTDYFGKGTLARGTSREQLTGTWGYTDAEAGAGTWILQRDE